MTDTMKLLSLSNTSLHHFVDFLSKYCLIFLFYHLPCSYQIKWKRGINFFPCFIFCFSLNFLVCDNLSQELALYLDIEQLKMPMTIPGYIEESRSFKKIPTAENFKFSNLQLQKAIETKTNVFSHIQKWNFLNTLSLSMSSSSTASLPQYMSRFYNHIINSDLNFDVSFCCHHRIFIHVRNF